MWSFVTGFFQLVSCFQGSTMLFHVLAFPFIAESYAIVWIRQILFHQLMDIWVGEHLCCFHLWAGMNNAAINIHVRIDL